MENAKIRYGCGLLLFKKQKFVTTGNLTYFKRQNKVRLWSYIVDNSGIGTAKLRPRSYIAQKAKIRYR